MAIQNNYLSTLGQLLFNTSDTRNIDTLIDNLPIKVELKQKIKIELEKIPHGPLYRNGVEKVLDSFSVNAPFKKQILKAVDFMQLSEEKDLQIQQPLQPEFYSLSEAWNHPVSNLSKERRELLDNIGIYLWTISTIGLTIAIFSYIGFPIPGYEKHIPSKVLAGHLLPVLFSGMASYGVVWVLDKVFIGSRNLYHRVNNVSSTACRMICLYRRIDNTVSSIMK